MNKLRMFPSKEWPIEVSKPMKDPTSLTEMVDHLTKKKCESCIAKMSTGYVVFRKCYGDEDETMRIQSHVTARPGRIVD